MSLAQTSDMTTKCYRLRRMQTRKTETSKSHEVVADLAANPLAWHGGTAPDYAQQLPVVPFFFMKCLSVRFANMALPCVQLQSQHPQ